MVPVSSPMQLQKRTYLFLVSLVAIWCGGILLAPALKSSQPLVSSFLYSFYGPICHQIDSHSFHLFGAKLGVCVRCSSIYFSFLLTLLVYPLARDLSSLSIPKRHWILLAMVPMVVDVLLGFTGIRPSTELTRAVSGALFGAILPLYLVPPLLEGIRQLRDQLLARGGSLYAGKAQ
jgi:uncharacterized membrane protein